MSGYGGGAKLEFEELGSRGVPTGLERFVAVRFSVEHPDGDAHDKRVGTERVGIEHDAVLAIGAHFDGDTVFPTGLRNFAKFKRVVPEAARLAGSRRNEGRGEAEREPVENLQHPHVRAQRLRLDPVARFRIRGEPVLPAGLKALQLIDEAGESRCAAGEQLLGAFLPEQGMNLRFLHSIPLTIFVEQARMLADQEIGKVGVGEASQPDPPAVHPVLLVAHHLGEVVGKAVGRGELRFRLPLDPAVVVLRDCENGLGTELRGIRDRRVVAELTEFGVAPVRGERSGELTVIRLGYQPRLMVFFGFQHCFMGEG